jgi:hypothetical protein
MSFLGGLFGNNGSNFQAANAPVIDPLQNQAGTASARSQVSIGQQQQLADALQQQGGIQNQSNIYNQLGQVASGQGPNPAQAMLNQQTGQNVANTAALMAGQRGASQNAGLIARQAGQQGANLQQQAVGQGATMQAQQSLNALGQQAGIAGQQVQNTLGAQQAATGAQQNQAGQLIGANTALNQANIANAGQMNQANAAIAAGNQKGQQNLLGGIASGIGSIFGLAEGGMVPHYADGGDVSESADGPMSSFGRALMGGTNDNPYATLGSGIGSALNSGIKSLFAPNQNSIANQAMQNTRNQSQLLGGNPVPSPSLGVTPQAPNPNAPNLGGSDLQFSNQGPSLMAGMARGGKVPAMVSPGEKYIPPSGVEKVAQGKESAIHAGRTIQGKAKVPGDSLKNDTVPKTLEEGGIVLPRSITQSKKPGPAAQKFVEALLAKQGKRAA